MKQLQNKEMFSEYLLENLLVTHCLTFEQDPSKRCPWIHNLVRFNRVLGGGEGGHKMFYVPIFTKGSSTRPPREKKPALQLRVSDRALVLLNLFIHSGEWNTAQ